MDADIDIAAVGSLVAEPSRASILVALMDRRSKTAKELALEAGVTPQTVSSHLGKLLAGRLLVVQARGRHRYFRLASDDVGRAVEALMAVAPARPVRDPGRASALEAMRAARTCYDHLAGRLGVAVTEAMVRARWIRPRKGDYRVSPRGEASLGALGIDLGHARRQRRTFARACLDWSERRPHLAGALGAAFASRCFELGWLRRSPDGRQVMLTERGRRELGR